MKKLLNFLVLSSMIFSGPLVVISCSPSAANSLISQSYVNNIIAKITNKNIFISISQLANNSNTSNTQAQAVILTSLANANPRLTQSDMSTLSLAPNITISKGSFVVIKITSSKGNVSASTDIHVKLDSLVNTIISKFINQTINVSLSTDPVIAEWATQTELRKSSQIANPALSNMDIENLHFEPTNPGVTRLNESAPTPITAIARSGGNETSVAIQVIFGLVSFDSATKINYPNDMTGRLNSVNFYKILNDTASGTGMVYRSKILTKFNWSSQTPTEQKIFKDIAFETEPYDNYQANKSQIDLFHKLIQEPAYPNNTQFMSWFSPTSSVAWNTRFDNLRDYLYDFNNSLPDAATLFNVFSGSVLTDQTDGNVLREDMMKLYNVLIKITSPTLVSRLVSPYTFQAKSGGAVASTSLETNNVTRKLSQIIKFYTVQFYRASFTANQYKLGFWSTTDPGSVLIHEVGHAISNGLWLSGILPLSGHSTRFYLNHKSIPLGDSVKINADPEPDDFIVQALGKTISLKIPLINTNPLYGKVAAYDIVRSNYGRQQSYGDGRYQNPDIFAEAFASWLLTPDSYKTQGWQLLNNFFTQTLINKFQGKTVN